MARRRIGRITRVKTNFLDYNYLLNGIGGIGKTTLLSEIGMKLCGQDGLLLLSVGREPMPDHLGGVWNERAKNWDDLEDIIDTLVEYKDEDYKNLKMVGIDSTDEIFRLAEAKVVEMHNNINISNPSKMVKTVSAAFGGFQKGENKVVDIVTELLFKLNDVGIKIFFIGHTKKKNSKDPLTEVEYELLTSNLDNKYYQCIKDKVNLVGCAYVERTMSDVKTVQDAFSKGNKKVGRIESEKRVISFRDEEYAIDNKSHFKFIEDKCDFDTDTFINTVEVALKKQADFYDNKTNTIQPKQDEVVQKEDVQEEPEIQEDPVVDVERNTEIKKQIQSSMKQAPDKEKAAGVKKILSEYGFNTLDINAPTQMFESIIKIFE